MGWGILKKLPKTNSFPLKMGHSQKESSLPTSSNHPFSEAVLVFGSIYIYNYWLITVYIFHQDSFWTKHAGFSSLIYRYLSSPSFVIHLDYHHASFIVQYVSSSLSSSSTSSHVMESSQKGWQNKLLFWEKRPKVSRVSPRIWGQHFFGRNQLHAVVKGKPDIQTPSKK